jgi:hypothetical protein
VTGGDIAEKQVVPVLLGTRSPLQRLPVFPARL